MTRPVPAGQEAILRGLAAAMFRTAAPVTVVVVVVGTVVGAVVAGGPGALGAALGGGIAAVASLITLAAIRVTAHLPPKAVMMASFASFITKMGVLLVALLVVDRVGGLPRLSIALSMLAVVITVTAAEGWAAYRMQSMTIDPEPSSPARLTSGPMTGMSGSSREGDRGEGVAGGPRGPGTAPAPSDSA